MQEQKDPAGRLVGLATSADLHRSKRTQNVASQIDKFFAVTKENGVDVPFSVEGESFCCHVRYRE